jgi:hypothetical protein
MEYKLVSSLTNINSNLHQICRESSGLYKVREDDATKKIREMGCGVSMRFNSRPVLSKNFNGNKQPPLHYFEILITELWIRILD